MTQPLMTQPEHSLPLVSQALLSLWRVLRCWGQLVDSLDSTSDDSTSGDSSAALAQDTAATGGPDGGRKRPLAEALGAEEADRLLNRAALLPAVVVLSFARASNAPSKCAASRLCDSVIADRMSFCECFFLFLCEGRVSHLSVAFVPLPLQP